MKLPKQLTNLPGLRWLKRRGRRTNKSVGQILFGPIPRRAPKQTLKRVLWYVHPQRFRDFWFTREGGKKVARVSATYGIAFMVFVAGLFIFFAKDLPSPGQINRRSLAQTTKFYDRTGEHLLYEVFGDQNRVIVDLQEISPHLRNATIAVEDKNFYNQGAFSSFAIIRAAINNGLNKAFGREGRIQGGSTITQQYVKNALLSPERTFSRKIKELILAIQIEELYDKDDILGLYLNEIPYGALAYGGQAASQTFFSKDAKDLTIEEAAMLAALPRAPTYYSPYGQHADDLVARQQMIIDIMRQQGYISEEEAEQAKAVDIIARVNDNPNYFSDIRAPHFVLMVQEELEQEYGTRVVAEGGLTVITTLDWEKQQIAERATKDGIGRVVSLGGDNAAFVAADTNTAQTLAMVGSRDFNHPKYGSFNAALSGRQPGSSFKPYGYATLFKTGQWGPGSIVYDVKTNFGGGYRPDNFDFRSKGAMPIRRALGESRNIPAVKALYIAGVDNVIEQAHKMGITTLNAGPGVYGLSLVLGAGEVKLYDHVNGYSTFATGGIHREPVNVLKVTNADGDVLEEWQTAEGTRVLDEEIAYSMTDILTDDAARSGTFGRNNPNLTVPSLTMAVKTGTTDLSRDGWMMGFTRHMTAGVWVGNHDNQPMHSITSQQTGPIFTDFMAKAHEDLPDLPFEKPAGLKTVTLDAHTGNLPTDATKSRHTDIFPSIYTPSKAQGVQTVTVNKNNNKLATDCTPKEARKEITVRSLEPEIPPSDPAYSRWKPPVAALAKSLGITSNAPTEKDTCDNPPEVTLSVEQKGNDDFFTLTAKVKAGATPVQTVQFYNVTKDPDNSFTAHPVNIKDEGTVIQEYPTNASNDDGELQDGKKYTFRVKVTDKDKLTAEATGSAGYEEPSGGPIPMRWPSSPFAIAWRSWLFF